MPRKVPLKDREGVATDFIGNFLLAEPAQDVLPAQVLAPGVHGSCRGGLHRIEEQFGDTVMNEWGSFLLRPRPEPAWARRAFLIGVVLFAARAACALEVGTTIPAEHVDEVTDLLLPGEVDVVRRGMKIEVAARRPVAWRRAYRLATEKNADQTRLGPHGELLGYVAGLPREPGGPGAPRPMKGGYVNFPRLSIGSSVPSPGPSAAT